MFKRGGGAPGDSGNNNNNRKDRVFNRLIKSKSVSKKLKKTKKDKQRTKSHGNIFDDDTTEGDYSTATTTTYSQRSETTSEQESELCFSAPCIMAEDFHREYAKSLPTPPKAHINDRLMDNDPLLVRLDITSSVLGPFDKWEREAFFAALLNNKTVTHVHFSGEHLADFFTVAEIEMLLDRIGSLEALEELFVFKGQCPYITGKKLGQTLQRCSKLKVLMIWGFANMATEPELAGAIRHVPNLERVTLTLPDRLEYAALDVFAMGAAGMPKLRCLSMRCVKRQFEPALSPEAMTVLMGSTAIDSMYLENLGLCDDHSDAIANELHANDKLTLLDLKHNLFSDDALFAFSIGLKQNSTMRSLDLSGVLISEKGVYTLAKALQDGNTTITNLELEGDAKRFQDEFDIPEGHTQTPYMQALNFQLRLNRAGKRNNRPQFVEALNMVSDHLGCLFHLLRNHPKYCNVHIPGMV